MGTNSKTAFVTGATGFVGINLVKLLIKSGWKITALHRSTSNLTYLRRFPVEMVEGSITDIDTIEKALPRNTEVVFHVAGDTNHWSRKNEMQTMVNVQGTMNMVSVAQKKGIKTFIHTSSVSAWGPVSGIIDESTPQLGGKSWINYERTKWLGEKEALKGMKQGMKVVILNPGDIIGPYDQTSWGTIFFLLKKNKLLGIPPGYGNFIHVDQVAKAHLSAVINGRNGENYLLGGISDSMYHFVHEFAQLLGVKTPRLMPALVIKKMAKLSNFTSKFTGIQPAITPELAEINTRKKVEFSSSKAINELGLMLTPWQDAVRDNFNWLTKEGIL